MEGKRQAKFSRQLQKEMGDVFLKEGGRLFGNQFISVSQVRVTPDLGYAKFYLSFLNEKDPQKLINLIKLHNKELRTMLAARIGKVVRKIPEVEFYYDDTMEYVAKMDKLFDEIRPKDDGNGTDVKVNEDDYKQ